MQIQSVEEGITYINKLKSIETWVKAEKKDAELQNIVAEQKLRTQRILGELIADGQRKGEIRKQNDGAVTTGREVTQIGLTHKQSSTFQAIASIPEDEFELFIEEKKQAVNNAVAELTTTGAVRLAKTLQDKERELKVTKGLSERLEVEKELKKLAAEINQRYTKDQRAFLISQIKQ